MDDSELQNLIARRLYWQLPIIAESARRAADRIKKDAIADPEFIRKPMTI